MLQGVTDTLVISLPHPNPQAHYSCSGLTSPMSVHKDTSTYPQYLEHTLSKKE